MSADAILEVDRLVKHFRPRAGLFGPKRGGTVVRAVDGVSFQLAKGATLGLVGETGCGKTTLGRMLLRLERPTEGRVLFDGIDLAEVSARELRELRGRVQMVFQDPSSSLNPRRTVLESVMVPLRVRGMDRGAASRRALELLEQVGISSAQAYRHPHQFSGGQRQRVGIARALATDPDVLVCDEPVSALDVSIQAQIVNLLQDLQRELGLSCVFITHDLAVVRHLASHVAVMYLGKIVEQGPCGEVFERPAHPYTRALLDAVPTPDPDARRVGVPLLRGEVTGGAGEAGGCPFRARCWRRQEICDRVAPALEELEPGRLAACHFAAEPGGDGDQTVV